MDPFTQRMLERARARQEKIDQKLASSGQTVAKRKPLTENQANKAGSPVKSPNKLIKESLPSPKKASFKSESPAKVVSRRSSAQKDQTKIASPQKHNDVMVTKKEFKSTRGSVGRRNSDVSLEINIMHSKDIQVDVQIEERDTPMKITYDTKVTASNVTAKKIKDNTENTPDKESTTLAPKSERSGLRTDIKSRLDRLGNLYSDKPNLSSPIHRTEQQFTSATPPKHDVRQTKPEEKKKYGRFAALADQINNWEDDLTHHNFHPEPAKTEKKIYGKMQTKLEIHDSSTLDVSVHSLCDINKVLQTTKTTQPKRVNSNSFKKPTVNECQRLQKEIVAELITEDDYVCETCRDLAMVGVNRSLHDDASGNEQEAGPSRRERTNVCLLCGCSILNRPSDRIVRENATDMQQSIINIIESTLAPRQITASDRVCHACWLRTKRQVIRMNRHDDNRSQLEIEDQNVNTGTPEISEPTSASNMESIVLPNYRRGPNSTHHCVFPNCSTTPLHNISDKLRATVLHNHNYYLPKLARICSEHLQNNSWDILYDAENSMDTFTVDHIQHVFSMVNSFSPSLDFENIQEMDEHIVQYWIGLSKEKFSTLLEEVPRVSELHRGSLGLAAFLLKMRTGDSDERIATLLKTPRRSLETLMDKVRDILCQDFVTKYLGINHLTHAELLQHNLLLPNGLFGGENNAIVICDGTYIYIHKSANYMFQKDTYSLHKYRNLLKPFMIVASDGYIVDCFGPYKATTSDAEIMTSLFRDEQCPLRLYFRNNDVFILDRGFRDCISLLEECGYRTYMPESLIEGEHQLTTPQANRSRCVTICRWVVEVVNGYFKRDFKLLRQEYFHRSLPHMMQNFEIAAALLNKFGVRLQDNVHASEILSIIRQNINLENNLACMVEVTNMNRRTANFTSITATANMDNNIYFPRLEYTDLILFALGTYQIKQARSYFGEHIRFHGGYRIEVYREFNFPQYNLRGSGDTTLIRGKIKSRHVSRKQYYVYILIENNIPGRAGIVEYCCSCLVGRRTVGCCAHTMTIVWYLGWARHQQNISAPAGFLDSIVIRDDEE